MSLENPKETIARTIDDFKGAFAAIATLEAVRVDIETPEEKVARAIGGIKTAFAAIATVSMAAILAMLTIDPAKMGQSPSLLAALVLFAVALPFSATGYLDHVIHGVGHGLNRGNLWALFIAAISFTAGVLVIIFYMSWPACLIFLGAVSVATKLSGRSFPKPNPTPSDRQAAPDASHE